MECLFQSFTYLLICQLIFGFSNFLVLIAIDFQYGLYDFLVVEVEFNMWFCLAGRDFRLFLGLLSSNFDFGVSYAFRVYPFESLFGC